jgi:diguanylate cyclase (GGDEF)-like protein
VSKRRWKIGLLGTFALASLVPIVVLGLVLAHFMAAGIRERAVSDAAKSAELIARLGVQPQLSPAEVSKGISPSRRRALDETLRTGLVRGDVARIKVWNRDSRVVYSNDHRLIGRTFPPSDELESALGGETESEISDLQKAENVAERHYGKLLEVYVPMRFGSGTAPAGVFEVYLPYSPIAAAIASDTRRLYLVLLFGLLLLYGALFQIVRQARRHEHQARTDELTGLGNRRKLITDLERTLAAGGQAKPTMLAIFDLDGFKGYNDTFGHPAGDVLLTRLGHSLERVMTPYGKSYRLGGDEFCVLGSVAGDRAATLLDLTEQALTEEGHGFKITSSFGAVFLPDEAKEPAEALRIADQRLYAQKNAHRLGRGRPHEVLLQTMFEREPDLRAHVSDVAALSMAIGRTLGLSPEMQRQLELVAELHDVGKLAIPDSVLRKPGPLNAADWAVVREHTVVGQRILGVAPILHEVGKIVRHTHECWNGTGYPDGLAGVEIPVAARIITVCDAYAAMTSDRAYRPAMTSEQAVAELRSCAGTQFDPDIAEIFCSLLDRGELQTHRGKAPGVAA